MSGATELVQGDLEEVVDQIRSGDRFLLTTHENPDGDALGSLLAMHQILGALGKDSVMFLAAKEFPDLDVSLRGAVSIARRLQDPLAELVKIDPKAIGVGLYRPPTSLTAR